jgi:hypothetical protein
VRFECNKHWVWVFVVFVFVFILYGGDRLLLGGVENPEMAHFISGKY